MNQLYPPTAPQPPEIVTGTQQGQQGTQPSYDYVRATQQWLAHNAFAWQNKDKDEDGEGAGFGGLLLPLAFLGAPLIKKFMGKINQAQQGARMYNGYQRLKGTFQKAVRWFTGDGSTNQGSQQQQPPAPKAKPSGGNGTPAVAPRPAYYPAPGTQTTAKK